MKIRNWEKIEIKIRNVREENDQCVKWTLNLVYYVVCICVETEKG